MCLCWIVIQSCDYDWISIFDVMDYMLSAWGSLKLAPKGKRKTINSDAIGGVSSKMGCAAMRLGKTREAYNAWHLAKRVIPPSEKDLAEALESAWLLAA